MTNQIAGANVRLMPFTPLSTQAGGAHSAVTDFLMAAQTEAIHVQALRGRRSWYWAGPGQAPTFYRSDSSTGYFQLSGTLNTTSYRMMCPFISHPGHTAIDAVAIIAKYSTARLVTRMSSTDLDVNDYATGPYVEVCERISMPLATPWMTWDGSLNMLEGVYIVRMRLLPDFTTSRILGLHVQGDWEVLNTEIINVSPQRMARLIALMVSDSQIEEGPDD